MPFVRRELDAEYRRSFSHSVFVVFPACLYTLDQIILSLAVELNLQPYLALCFSVCRRMSTNRLKQSIYGGDYAIGPVTLR
jgi:hypothetical protein